MLTHWEWMKRYIHLGSSASRLQPAHLCWVSRMALWDSCLWERPPTTISWLGANTESLWEGIVGVHFQHIFTHLHSCFTDWWWGRGRWGGVLARLGCSEMLSRLRVTVAPPPTKYSYALLPWHCRTDVLMSFYSAGASRHARTRAHNLQRFSLIRVRCLDRK